MLGMLRYCLQNSSLRSWKWIIVLFVRVPSSAFSFLKQIATGKAINGAVALQVSGAGQWQSNLEVARLVKTSHRRQAQSSLAIE